MPRPYGLTHFTVLRRLSGVINQHLNMNCGKSDADLTDRMMLSHGLLATLDLVLTRELYQLDEAHKNWVNEAIQASVCRLSDRKGYQSEMDAAGYPYGIDEDAVRALVEEPEACYVLRDLADEVGCKLPANVRDALAQLAAVKQDEGNSDSATAAT
jgi:hypothetical protein